MSILGDEAQGNYKSQRMFGSIGWGATMFIMGMVLDHSRVFQEAKCQTNEGQRNYNVCFFVFSILMFIALVVGFMLPFKYKERPGYNPNKMQMNNVGHPQQGITFELQPMSIYLKINLLSHIVSGSKLKCFYFILRKTNGSKRKDKREGSQGQDFCKPTPGNARFYCSIQTSRKSSLINVHDCGFGYGSWHWSYQHVSVLAFTGTNRCVPTNVSAAKKIHKKTKRKINLT